MKMKQTAKVELAVLEACSGECWLAWQRWIFRTPFKQPPSSSLEAAVSTSLRHEAEEDAFIQEEVLFIQSEEDVHVSRKQETNIMQDSATASDYKWREKENHGAQRLNRYSRRMRRNHFMKFTVSGEDTVA